MRNGLFHFLNRERPPDSAWHRTKARANRIVLLSAAALTLLMALPRLVIIGSLKARFYSDISWLNFSLKTLFFFAAAVLFMKVNMNREKFITRIGVLNMSSFRHRALVSLLLYLIVRFIGLQLDLAAISVASSEQVQDGLFSITLMLELCFSILLSQVYVLFTTNEDIRVRNQLLQKVNAETTFEVLKNQVNPHFLFNSLNAVNAMIGIDNDGARTFVSDMSTAYRYVLSSVNKPLVSLFEELEFVQCYLNMLQKRHSHGLRVEISVPEVLHDRLIPPMSLQVLVENAVKHNVVSAKSPLLLTIAIEGSYVVVSNPICERKVKPQSTGTGLFNICQRYKFLCNDEVKIRRDSGFFQVSLPLIEWPAVKAI